MGIFDANLRTIRRAIEHLWRDLAKQASDDGYLTMPRARLELRMTLWVFEEGKRTASKMWESKTKYDLDTESAKELFPKPKSVWARLMTED